MENITLTLDELNKMPKNAIALLYMQMSESFTILSAQSQKIQDQNERLIRQIEDLQEQIAILTQQRFGKRTETDNQVLGQLAFSLENMCILNEAEVLVENGIPDEPDMVWKMKSIKNFSIFRPDLKYWNIISKYMPVILTAAVFCVQKRRNVCWRIVFLPRSWPLLFLMQSM